MSKRGTGAGLLIDLEMKRQGYSNKTLAYKIGRSEGVVRNARRMDYEVDGPEISASVLIDIALGLGLDPQEVILMASIPPEYRHASEDQVKPELSPLGYRVGYLFEQLPAHIQESFIDMLATHSDQELDGVLAGAHKLRQRHLTYSEKLASKIVNILSRGNAGSIQGIQNHLDKVQELLPATELARLSDDEILSMTDDPLVVAAVDVLVRQGGISTLEKMFYLLSPSYPDESWESVSEDTLWAIRDTWNYLVEITRHG